MVNKNQFYVDAVIGERVGTDGRAEYLVKWSGHHEHESTWEPRRSLTAATVAEWTREKARMEEIEADVDDADVQDANLEDANLEDANLEDANLEDANLEDANLEDANLVDANLDYEDVAGAGFNDGEVADTDMADSEVLRATEQQSQLPDTSSEAQANGHDNPDTQLENANVDELCNDPASQQLGMREPQPPEDVPELLPSCIGEVG